MKNNLPHFKSERYKLDKYISESKWGNIYFAKDVKTEEDILIQILDYKKSLEDIKTQKEIYDLVLEETNKIENSANKNIVPRILNYDDRGQEFLMLPSYETGNNYETINLESIIENKHYKNGLNIDFINQIMKDTLLGISELNSSLGRPHSNIKPDSFIMTYNKNEKLNKTLLLNLDTISYYHNSKKNQNSGYIYTMSPEVFKGEKPTMYSNIWSLSSLYFRLFTGKYVFEDEFNSKKDPEKWIKNLSIRKGNKLINKKIRTNEKYLPEYIRFFLKQTLNFKQEKRNYDVMQRFIPKTGINLLNKILNKESKYKDSDIKELYNHLDKVVVGFNQERVFKKYVTLARKIVVIGGGLFLSTFILYNQKKISDGLSNKTNELELKAKRLKIFRQLADPREYTTKIDTTKDRYDVNYSKKIEKNPFKMDSLRQEFSIVQEELKKYNSK